MLLQPLRKSGGIILRIYAVFILCMFFLLKTSSLKAQWVEPDSLLTLEQLKQSFQLEDQFNEEEVVKIAGIANVSSGTLHETYLQIYIQNDSTGLPVFGYEIGAPVGVGDSVVIKGRRQMYFGQPELLITDYRVYPGRDIISRPINVFEAFKEPEKYTGMVVEGTGIVQGKGTQFNGKYLDIALTDTSEETVMVYVSNFHVKYQEFDFNTPRIGDKVSIIGVMGQYDPAAPESRVFKVFLRNPDDISYAGWPKYYFEITAILLVLLILIGLVWMFSLRRQVKRKTKALQESLDEKEILIKEIHHRVKNNLAGISGLLALQSEATDSIEVQEAMQESQARIASMMMVHEKLYQSSSLMDISVEQYLKDLCRNITSMMSNGATDVDLEIQCDEIRMSTDQIIPLGLLVNELLVNAYKHAFYGKEEGIIRIEVEEENNFISLMVEDNGIGLADDFDAQKSDTLGMLLISTFSQQLNAEKRVRNTPGACFMFEFPANVTS